GLVAEHAAADPFTAVVNIDSHLQAGADSPSLTAGTSYLFTVSGTYRYFGDNPNFHDAQADAECTNLPPDTTFQRNRWAAADPQGDYADLYVAGNNVDWQAHSPDPFGCDPNHTYTYVYNATSTGPVHFTVHEDGPTALYSDNYGLL